MKLYYTISLIILSIFICKANAQQNLPNNSFENWEEIRNDQGQLLYEEPTGNFWGSLNKLRLLGGPVTTIKSTDAFSGNFSAHLETKSFGTFKIPGLLATGFFSTTEVKFIEGKPFVDKPQKISFHCKYFPQNNDSASVFVCLTKYNNELQQKDTIAQKSYIIRGELNSYTKIELELDYQSTLYPDSINIVFVSSAGTRGLGSSQNAQLGSTLIIDDVNLIYEPSEVKIEHPIINLSYNKFENSVAIKNFSNLNNIAIKIYNINSQLVFHQQLQETSEQKISLNSLSRGIYFVVISNSNTVLDYLKISVDQ